MKKYIIIAASILVASCSNNLEDLNKNIKDPSAVSGESLFTGAQKALIDKVVEINVNENNTQLWSQYLQETTYADESNYDQITRSIPENFWSAMYRESLKNLDVASKVIAETTYVSPEDEYTNNKLQIIEIMKVYAYSNLVVTFGDIPYTEALNTDILTPKYDDGMTVYKDLIARLTAAISTLDDSNESFIHNEDNLYGGDVESWIKFANSLKLRMGIVLADADTAFAKTTVESAIAGGILTSSADNANLAYRSSAPNTNPVHTNVVLSGRNDFVAGATIIDIMNDLNDPRRPLWFEKTSNDIYEGGEIGTPSTYSLFSHLSAQVIAANAPGVIMSYSEVQFLLAEAAARGYITGDTAANHYAAAITASIAEWGGSAADTATYLAQPSVDYASALAASTATTPWKEVIGTQRWISLFSRGVEAWLSIRLMDYPAMAVPTEAVSGFPNRYTYPIVEQTINAANYNAAASAIGEDTAEQKLFYDKF
jgi:hypothetical protein